MSHKLPLAPAFTYPAAGRCIYCGSADGRLTKEHIIARGLNGNFILPAASCDACAAITSDVERRVLRGFMEDGRLAMGLASRHKKHERPTSLSATFIGADDTKWATDVPIVDGLQVIHLPIFILPLSLGGEAKESNPNGIEIRGFDTMHFGDAPAVLREHAATAIQFEHPMDVFAFARMLGKIAHAYYIAEKGWFPLESPVLPVVLGKSEHAKVWIGCLEHAPLTRLGSKALHLMDIVELPPQGGTVCSLVRIKLFSPTEGPTYAVVTRIRPAVNNEPVA